MTKHKYARPTSILILQIIVLCRERSSRCHQYIHLVETIRSHRTGASETLSEQSWLMARNVFQAPIGRRRCRWRPCVGLV